MLKRAVEQGQKRVTGWDTTAVILHEVTVAWTGMGVGGGVESEEIRALSCREAQQNLLMGGKERGQGRLQRFWAEQLSMELPLAEMGRLREEQVLAWRRVRSSALGL